MQRTLMAYADLYHLCPARTRAHGLSATESAPPTMMWGAHRARGRSGASRAGAPVSDAAARQRQARLQDRGRARHRAFRDIPGRALRCRASSCRGCGSRARTPENASALACSRAARHTAQHNASWCGAACRIERRGSTTLLAIKGDAVGQGTSRDHVAQLFETEALLNRHYNAQELMLLALRQLAVNGTDLRALGLRGRPVGEMLHAPAGRRDRQPDRQSAGYASAACPHPMEEQHVK